MASKCKFGKCQKDAKDGEYCGIPHRELAFWCTLYKHDPLAPYCLNCSYKLRFVTQKENQSIVQNLCYDCFMGKQTHNMCLLPRCSAKCSGTVN